jgi:hypothetical protein
VSLVVLTLVSVSFGMYASDNAQAAFIQPLDLLGLLPSTFIAYDTAWNDAGTMAVVVGFDSSGTPGTNAYSYWASNDTYTPIANAGYNQQKLHAVDFFSQPIYDWPNVLLVDADWMEEGLISYYSSLFSQCNAYVDTWDVWYGMTKGMTVNQGKPTAADMAAYDLVVWIPSRYMAGYMGLGGDAFNINDQNQVSLYLNGGGNFFLSNLDFTTYYWSTFSLGGFANDYLGASGYGSMSYEYYVRNVSADAVFGGLGTVSQNWGVPWGGFPPGHTDNLWTAPGATYCFQGGSSDMLSWAYTGLRYDSGSFKSIYFAFPLETLPVYYASEIMQKTLDWITAPSPDQSSDSMGSWGLVNAGFDTGDPFAQSFIPSIGSISKVEFYMYAFSSTFDDFNIEIRNDVGGFPGGIAYASGMISHLDVPVGSGNAKWVQCEFGGGGTSLTIGQTYWITCTRIGSSTPQYWYIDTASSYPNGTVKGYSGSWNTYSYDFLFRTYPQISGATPKSITLTPVKDTTIYDESSTLSNGAGDYLFAGTNWNPDFRRALMEFNIASAIPKYSTITSAQLTMYCSYAYNSNAEMLSLHMLYNEWGEANSHAPANEEWGTNAEMGDATWQHCRFNTNSWGSPGGDYALSSTATQWVGTSDNYYTWSSSKLAEDVQVCLDVPFANHGWILIGNEGSLDTYKRFNSVNNTDVPSRPQLMITYTEPTIIGYEDTFWIAGDTTGAPTPTPPATVYKIMPSDGLKLKSMNNALSGDPPFYALAVDDIGNPLCAGQGISNLYYFDGSNWNTFNGGIDLTAYSFSGLDFNPNDRRFYLTGMDFMIYTDRVPLIYGESRIYLFDHFPNYGGSLNSDLAWNELYNYGLVGGDTYFVKVWPYGEYSNGTVRYELINSNPQDHHYDISWDTDGWNEAGIVGTQTGYAAYWRYYNTNPQLMGGFTGGIGTYYTCAMKPPASPKWLFIPLAGGSIRANILEKDESREVTVSSEFPHIFTAGMWKQSDPARLPTFGTQVEADSTYTFFIECNYTRNGADQWSSNLGIYFQVWWDGGLLGINSNPGDMTWALNDYRTRQFNISYNPALGTAALNYPNTGLGVQEFAIHSFWEDPAHYGADFSHYRLYINVTFGKQTSMAPGDGSWISGNRWDVNTLNDQFTWDFKASLFDTGVPEAYNVSYDEFGVQRLASLSVMGNPSGSIPPGGNAQLGTPNYIYYSSNAMYQLNVSIPHLYKNGNPASPNWIPATSVRVQNQHTDATAIYSDISAAFTPFSAPNNDLCIWGKDIGTYIGPVGNGTITAGPSYTDFTAVSLAQPFEVTPLWWWVWVPIGTPEGIYRGTITITLWSY